MKRPTIVQTILGLGALLLASCALPLAPAQPGPAGTLTVQAGSLGGRTILPVLGTLTYDLAMVGPGGQTVTESNDPDGLFSLKNLALGSWTATVQVRSDGALVASGTVSQVLSATSVPTLVVPISWTFTGTTTALVFSVDASASPYPVLGARVYWDGVLTSDTLDLGSKTISLSFGSQTPGLHHLRIIFYRDQQKTLPVGTFDRSIVCLEGFVVPNIAVPAGAFHPVGRPEMVDLAGGSFPFGGAIATVSAFQMAKYPVTQAQFQAIMGFNPSQYDNSDTSSRANPEAPWSPVENVTWFDAAEFTNRLSLAEGLQPVYTLTGVARTGNNITSATVTTDLKKNGYRLPTEAEYEYATRAGTTTDYFWGGLDGADYSWGSSSAGSPLTRPYGVGQKLPNAWGLYDMVGNVWSWLNDYSAAQPTVATFDYVGPTTGSEKLLRGGSFLSSSSTTPTLNTAFRSGNRGLDDPPGTAMTDVGFRVVRRPQTEPGNPTAALYGSIPAATLDSGYGRFLHVAPDQQYPGKFLVSGVSGVLDNTGISPWGTNLMARFNADATLDPTFGNNTDGPLNAAQLPYGPNAMFGPFGQTGVIQSQYGNNESTGLSYFSGFAQNAYGLYLFQPSVAGGWTHTEVFRHNKNGLLDVNYSQPVYTPGTESYLPFVVYAEFRALTPPVVGLSDAMFSAGYDAETGHFAVTKMAANGAFPWQNDPANKVRYFDSGLSINDFTPVRTVLQPDQKLLVIGNDSGGANGRLVRIDVSGATGSLDPGFGAGGTFVYNNGNMDGSQRHYSDVQYFNGKIYVTGWDYVPALGAVSGFVLRLNSDGSFDTTFAPGGNNGLYISVSEPQFVLAQDHSYYPAALAVNNHGLVVVGSMGGPPSRAFVQRLSVDGAPQGVPVVLRDQGYGAEARSVAIDGQARVAVAGFTNHPGATEPYQTQPAFWRF